MSMGIDKKRRMRSASRRRKGSRELRPLRKVLGWNAGKEVLECGHEQWPRQDIAGDTNATRRRCIRCPKRGIDATLIQHGDANG